MKERSSGIAHLGAAPLGGVDSSSVWAPKKAPPQNQVRRMSEAKQIEVVKKVSLQKKNKQVPLFDLKYPTFCVFTLKFVAKDDNCFLIQIVPHLIRRLRAIYWISCILMLS